MPSESTKNAKEQKIKIKRTMPVDHTNNSKNHSPCSRLNGVSSLFHPSSSLTTIEIFFRTPLDIKKQI
jgi:hypothetical protein